jgi:hypothetical protein
MLHHIDTSLQSCEYSINLKDWSCTVMHIWVQVTDVSGTESSAVTNDDLLDVCVLCTKIDKHQQY